LKYPEDDLEPKSGAQIVGELEQLDIDDLKQRLESAGLSTSGSKSELVVRLALYAHKRTEVQAGRLSLQDMNNDELKELASGMGLKSGGESLLKDLEKSFQVE
jgi:hypothetical protein